MLLLAAAVAATLEATPVSLPAGPPVSMDYLALDTARHRMWAPAGNTGSVYVIDGAKVLAIGGQATAPSPRPGRPNMGASSATVAGDRVYVGNRADQSLCAFDAAKLDKLGCVAVGSKPDGVGWVGATREVWVTTPANKSLTVIDPASGKRAEIKLEGDPEGLAVDDAAGVFYTNYEDLDRTLAIDVKTRKIAGNWPTGCGAEGPRGIALDPRRHFLFAGCGAGGAVVLDTAHGGRLLARLDTAGGVDNIDFADGLLFVASGKDGLLTVARVADDGKLTPVGVAKTAEGARAVVAGAGTAYVADSRGGKIWLVKIPPVK
jgi:DNA-binding beta-propeller fold protein YncE